MAGANDGTRRRRPNLLITGTPGTIKSTTTAALAKATNLWYICIRDLVKEKNLHDGWDDKFKCHIINEDLDIAAKVMAFSDQGPRTICILSASGAVCRVTLRQASHSGGIISYEVVVESFVAEAKKPKQSSVNNARGQNLEPATASANMLNFGSVSQGPSSESSEENESGSPAMHLFILIRCKCTNILT